MRDNYVGDVGDFYKYRLLRELCGITSELPKQRLGVVWYLYPDKCKDTDGLHLDYLSEKKREQFRPSDSELYDNLQRLIKDGDRSVRAVRERGILPSDTKFFEEPLTLSHLSKGNKVAIQERLDYRQAWLERALEATKDCDVVFFDPDNGLEVKCTPKHSDRGPKFVFYDELLPFWERGQSLIIYQHKNLHQKAEAQISERQEELRGHLGCGDVQAHYYSKYGGRIFLLVGR